MELVHVPDVEDDEVGNNKADGFNRRVVQVAGAQLAVESSAAAVAVAYYVSAADRHGFDFVGIPFVIRSERQSCLPDAFG